MNAGRVRALLQIIEQLPSVAESWNTYSDTEELLAWQMTYARVIEHRHPTLAALPAEVRERLAATLSAR